METWCGEDVSMGNSWDQEEEVEIGMWSNSQQDNRSNEQNTWNYKHKGSNKVGPPSSRKTRRLDLAKLIPDQFNFFMMLLQEK